MAQEIIEVLLGQKKSEKHAEFFEHIRVITGSDPIGDQRKSKKQSYNPASGVRNSAPTYGISSGSVSPIITTDESIPTIPELNQNTSMTARTSDSTTNQNSWRKDFPFGSNRRKSYARKKMSKIISSLVNDGNFTNISSDIKYLKKFQKRRKLIPSLKPKEACKKHLKKIAMAVIGRGKFGEGNQIFSEMKSLAKKIRQCPNKIISEEICGQIAKTLESLYEPPIERLDEILEYAEKYTRNRLKKRALESKGAAAGSGEQENEIGKNAKKNRRKKLRKKKLNAQNTNPQSRKKKTKSKNAMKQIKT